MLYRVLSVLTFSILLISSCATNRGPRRDAPIRKGVPGEGFVGEGSRHPISQGFEAMVIGCNESDREGLIEYSGTEHGPMTEQPRLTTSCKAGLDKFNEGLGAMRDQYSGRPDKAMMVVFGMCNASDFDKLVYYYSQRPGPGREQPEPLSPRCKIATDLYYLSLQ